MPKSYSNNQTDDILAITLLNTRWFWSFLLLIIISDEQSSCTFYRTLSPSTECHETKPNYVDKANKIVCHGNVP